MSLQDLANTNMFDEDSEEDEDIFIPVPYRFHELAEINQFELLNEEIKKNNNRAYNPNEVNLSLDQEDNYGFTPLHIAIMKGNIDTIRVCIENGVKLELKTEGIPYSIFLLLFAAVTNVFEDNLYEVLKMLVIPEKMDTMKDRLGRTIAHVAACYNMVDVLDKILGDFPMLVEAVDNEGNSLLHSACKSNSVDSATFLMDNYSQLAGLVNKNDQNALHVCLEWNAIECYQALIRMRSADLDIHAEDVFGVVPVTQWKKIMEMKREKGTSEFPHELSKTLVVIPSPYDAHKTCDNPPKRTESVLPPEKIQRLNVLVNKEYGGSLLNKVLEERLDFVKEENMLELSHILRIHDFNYVMKIMKCCSKASKSSTGFCNVDTDTIVSSKTLGQARCAAKAVCSAVDALYKTATTSEGYRNAFCCVRPPGHHIGTNGPINNPNNNSVSQGFCLFNNVAIAAGYARSHYSSVFKRIAILDFDIHHGNGTEDCIQHLCPCEKTTVNVVENMEVKHHSYQYKPWLDESDSQNVFFASIHGYGKLVPAGIDYFYPGSGHSPNQVDYVQKEVTGIDFSKPDIIDMAISKQQSQHSFYWREHLRMNVFPRLLEFKPDLIFLSSGFDGHKNDVLNNGFGGLTESDFSYVTSEIQKIANSVCEGRVISVLEGGYNMMGGCGSPLALSVQAHVEALSAHYYSECEPEEWKKSSEMEKEECGQVTNELVQDIPIIKTITEMEKEKEKYKQMKKVDMEEEPELEEELEEEEEGSFDFDNCSEEEEEKVKTSNPVVFKKQEERMPVEKVTPVEIEEEDNDDGSEDLVNYDMPDIEENELNEIIDPFAMDNQNQNQNQNQEVVETGRRKRTRAKVDYVALEAQLKKEEEEMKQKLLKLQQQQQQ